jgi:WD40 repeat protein
MLSVLCEDEVIVLDSSTGEFTKSKLEKSGYYTKLSPDGLSIINVDDFNEVSVLDVSTGSVLKNVCMLEGRAYIKRISPDGLRLLYECGDGSVKIRSLDTGELLRDLGVTNSHYIDFSKTMICMLYDLAITIHDPENYSEIESIDAKNPSVISASPSGSLIVTNEFNDRDDAELVCRDVRTRTVIMWKHGFDISQFHSIVFSPNDEFIGLASSKYESRSTLKIIRALTGEVLFQTHTRDSCSLCFMEDSLTVVIGDECTLYVLDCTKFEIVSSFSLPVPVYELALQSGNILM